MKIITDSGEIVVRKRSTYAKFLHGYLSTGAFSDSSTLAAALQMGNEIAVTFPSISAYDLGVLVGYFFIHRPSDALLEALTKTKHKRE